MAMNQNCKSITALIGGVIAMMFYGSMFVTGNISPYI